MRKGKTSALCIALVGVVVAFGINVGSYGAAPHQQPLKFAVLIGNSDYDGDGKLTDTPRSTGDRKHRYMPDLPVSARDLLKMRRKLGELGFEIDPHQNADKSHLARIIERFNRRVAESGPDDINLFYYTGHSVQVEETLYLIPTKTKLVIDPILGRTGPLYIYRGTATEPLVALTDVNPPGHPLGGHGFTLLIIDSCRDNPWPDLANRGVRTTEADLNRTAKPKAFGLDYLPSVGTGYPRRATGTILADAASPGSEALGINDDSPFTEALIKHLGERKHFVDIFVEAAREVRHSTSGLQAPQIYYDPYTADCLKTCSRADADIALPTGVLERTDVQEAFREYESAIRVTVSARELAQTKSSQKAIEVEIGPPPFETVPPTPPSPPPKLEGAQHVHFSEYELQEIDYTGGFKNNLQDGLGVSYFDCASVFLRDRCPLQTLHQFAGEFHAGEAQGLGASVNSVTAAIELGRFNPSSDELGVKGAKLISGQRFLPDGSRLVGTFEDERLRHGIEWDPYSSKWTTVDQ